MRRKYGAILTALALTAAILCGCGSSSGAAEAPMAPASGAAADNAYPTGEMDFAAQAEMGTVSTGSGGDVRSKTEAKLIYTAGLELESTAFDDTVQGLADLTEQCGGYFASSSVSSYGSGYRYADYTVRVPSEQFDSFLSRAGELCHVLHKSSGAEDVSEEYYDIAGRLKTQQTKLARLQELLGRAETMEDIITIEDAVSQTEQQIEYLSGTLQHYDALVDYATVSISLSEVYRLSNTEEPAQSFGGRLVTALQSGWRNFVSGMEGFVIALAYGWMWVVIFAAAIAVAVRSLRKRAKARAAGDALRPRPLGQRGADQTKEPDDKNQSM